MSKCLGGPGPAGCSEVIARSGALQIMLVFNANLHGTDRFKGSRFHNKINPKSLRIVLIHVISSLFSLRISMARTDLTRRTL